MSDVLVLPRIDLTPAFARPQGQEENSFEGQMFQGGLFYWFKWSLCQLVQHQGEITGGNAPPSFGSVSVETIQETSEILIFADINGRIPPGSQQWLTCSHQWCPAVTLCPGTGTEGSQLLTLQEVP